MDCYNIIWLFFTYHETYKSAGIEAFGCANITTGLVNPKDIEDIVDGDTSKIDDLQEAINWTVDHKHIFEDQYIILFDGTIVAPDKNLEQQGFYAGDSFYIDEKAVKEIRETGMLAYSEMYEYGGMKRLTGYAPIFKDHNPNNEIIALSAIDFDGNLVRERTLDSIKGSSFIGFVLLTTFGMLTIFIIKSKIKPISKLTAYASKIAEGDLTSQEIKINNQDEIGVLAATLGIMSRNLRTLILQFNLNAQQVADSSRELEASTDRTNQAANQIAEMTGELVDGMIDKLKILNKRMNL